MSLHFIFFNGTSFPAFPSSALRREGIYTKGVEEGDYSGDGDHFALVVYGTALRRCQTGWLGEASPKSRKGTEMGDALSGMHWNGVQKKTSCTFNVIVLKEGKDVFKILEHTIRRKAFSHL
jgi:hypothetical protein